MATVKKPDFHSGMDPGSPLYSGERRLDREANFDVEI